MNIEAVARICHETNRAYCEALGDSSQHPWETAADWQRQSAIAGVKFRVLNPGAPPSAQHEAWFKAKAEDGWRYGAVKNAETKEHPCMVPYDELPIEQRLKDGLFGAVVDTVLPIIVL